LTRSLEICPRKGLRENIGAEKANSPSNDGLFAFAKPSLSEQLRDHLRVGASGAKTKYSIFQAQNSVIRAIKENQ
jgi:hypothetical protein